MTNMPPVPPASRSPKSRDPGSHANPDDKKPDDRQRNLDQQGRQGNIKQNTTNQGYQQDR